MAPSPKELILSELNKYEKCLHKSTLAFFEKRIDFNTHKTHILNLLQLINQYKEAYYKLKTK